MIPVVIWGAGGRMGGRLVRLVATQPDFKLLAAVETPKHPGIGSDAGIYHGLKNLDVALSSDPGPRPAPGVVLDFSLPGGTGNAARWAVINGWALVTGTTAISKEENNILEEAANHIPVLPAPNFSVGIQLLLNLIAKTSRALPDGFEVTISETHHREKKDRPSGTAKALEKIIKGSSPDRVIDSASLRVSLVVGEHDIRFVSPTEEILFSHRVLDRDVFAEGALQAARWIINQVPGTYSMADVLNLT